VQWNRWGGGVREVTFLSFEQFDGSSIEYSYSEEGFMGGLKGFLLGVGANLVSLPIGGPVLAGAATAAIGTEQAKRANKLKQEILAISKRIVDIKTGDVKKAKAEGLRVHQDDIKPLTTEDVVKSALLGGFLFSIYTGYKGHEIEELNKEMAVKMMELKIEFAKIGHDPERRSY